MVQCPDFKVGDVVGIHESKDKTARYKVIEIGDDLTVYPPGKFIDVQSIDGLGAWRISGRQLNVIFFKANPVCEHEWKRLDLFRTTEFHCTKCSSMRPFDIEKDEAA